MGGCGGGGRATLPTGETWDTVAHEYGHALGNLGDEYCCQMPTNCTYTGSEPDAVNLTTNTDRKTIKWRTRIGSSVPVPTGTGKCAGYNQGTKLVSWDDNQTVGLFEGGGCCDQGIYRPVINCRMNSNLPRYCPVCYTHMKYVTKDYMKSSVPGAGELKEVPDVTEDKSGPATTDVPVRDPEDIPIEPATSNGYVRLKVHVDNGQLSVTDVKEVPGPFITSKALGPGHAYEVLIDGEPISTGFLPDVGVHRPLASRNAPGPKGKHHTTTRSCYDFYARIPKTRVTSRALPKMKIVLYQVHQPPEQIRSKVPSTGQSGVRSTKVGHVTGLKADKLSPYAHSRLEKILNDNAEK